MDPLTTPLEPAPPPLPAPPGSRLFHTATSWLFLVMSILPVVARLA